MKDKPSIAEVANLVPEATDLREIGSGGYKVVYLAKIRGQSEAIKLVRIPTDVNDPSTREENIRRIEREIGILRQCRTPNLVKLGSIVPRPAQIGSEGYVLYSEEFIPGRSLRELINGGHRPTAQDLATVGVCLLHAVGELSAMNVIHRDIKPENIMQAELPGRRYIVLDLGIAFQVGGTPITRDAGRIPGTLYYIAPEMLDVGFRQNLDYRADLYTIGLTLYEYASGRNPFKDPSDPPFSTLYRIKTLTPAPLASHRPDLPNEFCGLVDQLMKKIPALRPSGVPTLLGRMEGFQ
jgi:serine/threonine-protein kinase